jgi:hypothetical protein
MAGPAVVVSAERLRSSGYPQHGVFDGEAGVPLHPHPVPPLDLIAASSAQHALTAAGAGPPQQPAAGVFRGSSERFVCLVSTSSLQFAGSRPATCKDGDRRQWTHAVRRDERASFRGMARPYRQGPEAARRKR